MGLLNKVEKWLDTNLPKIEKQTNLIFDEVIKTGEKAVKKIDDMIDEVAKKYPPQSPTTTNHHGVEKNQKTSEPVTSQKQEVNSTKNDNKMDEVIIENKKEKIIPVVAYSEGEIANLNYMPLLLVAEKLNMNVQKNEINYTVNDKLYRFHVVDNSWYDFQSHQENKGAIDFVQKFLETVNIEEKFSKEKSLKILNEIYYQPDYQEKLSLWIQQEQQLDHFTRKPKKKP